MGKQYELECFQRLLILASETAAVHGEYMECVQYRILQNNRIFCVGRDLQGSSSPDFKWMTHMGIKPTALVSSAPHSNQLSKLQECIQYCTLPTEHSIGFTGWAKMSSGNSCSLVCFEETRMNKTEQLVCSERMNSRSRDSRHCHRSQREPERKLERSSTI